MTKINTHIKEKFTGILQLVPSLEEELRTLQTKIKVLFPEQEPLPKLHITLLHQSFPKKVLAEGSLRGDKALKALFKSSDFQDKRIAGPQLTLGKVFISTQGERTSTFVEILEDAECRSTRDNLLVSAGINPEDIPFDDKEIKRKFHISLTNLTGNGGDSIAFPTVDEDGNILDTPLEVTHDN